MRRKRYLEEQDEDIDEQEVTEEKINKPESSLNKFQLSKALVEVVSDEKGCALENVKKDFNIKKQSR